MAVAFNFIQTCFIDPNKVAGATDVFITSVELFFKTAPTSGSRGVTIWLCATGNNGRPTPSVKVKGSLSNLSKSSINTDTLSQAGTIFSFANPILVKTGKKYGIVIKFDSDDYSLWTNKKGDALTSSSGKTTNASEGSSKNFDGELYTITNSTVSDPLDEEDLKFNLTVSKFKTSNASIYLVNKDYEFLTFKDKSSASFKGGEWVYANTANEAGTITTSKTLNYITGSGTTLTNHTVGDRIIVANATYTDVLTIVSVANATYATVDKNSDIAGSFGYKVPPSGKVYRQNIPDKELILDESNAANATFLFAVNDVLYGSNTGAYLTINSIESKDVDMFNAKFKAYIPSMANYTVRYKFANTNNNLESTFSNFEVNQDTRYRGDATQKRILSRSAEVVGSSLYGTRKKSAVIEVTFTGKTEANQFQSPFLDSDQFDLITSVFDVNSTSLETRYGHTDYDTEVDKTGLARAKYISKIVSLKEGKYAEDIDVLIGAYRPYGTNVNVYAKIHNSQDPQGLNDKSWTPLVLRGNADIYSLEANTKDIREYNYKLPQYPYVASTVTDVVFTNQSNSTVLTSIDVATTFPAGIEIRIYDPLFSSTNHGVFKILSSNSTSFTVDRAVANTGIPSNPFVDILQYKNTVWNNIENDNVSRYFATSGKYDGFNSMQIKIVMLSESTHLTPKVEQVMAIAVSS